MLKYDLSFNLPVPDDVDLDWSQVSKGIMEKAETSIITGMIKKLKSVPLNYHGNLSLFAGEKSKLGHLKVSNFKTVPAQDGIDLSFVADLSL